MLCNVTVHSTERSGQSSVERSGHPTVERWMTIFVRARLYKTRCFQIFITIIIFSLNSNNASSPPLYWSRIIPLFLPKSQTLQNSRFFKSRIDRFLTGDYNVSAIASYLPSRRKTGKNKKAIKLFLLIESDGAHPTFVKIRRVNLDLIAEKRKTGIKRSRL